MNFDIRRMQNVPESLQNVNQWILWKNINRNGKSVKLPWSVFDEPAKSTGPETWSSFECVVMRYDERKHAGIGFVFADGGGYAGVDLDGCRDPKSGVIDDWAWKYIDGFRGYTEISPSGTGVKIFIRTTRKITGINAKLDHLPVKYGKTPGIEAYTQGRYFAVTGDVVRGYEG